MKDYKFIAHALIALGQEMYEEHYKTLRIEKEIIEELIKVAGMLKDPTKFEYAENLIIGGYVTAIARCNGLTDAVINEYKSGLEKKANKKKKSKRNSKVH